MAAIPAVIVVSSIPVVISIRPVALLVIGDQVVEGEAVVRSDVVHALVGVIGAGAAVGEKIVATIDAQHQVRNHSRITSYKSADVVPEAPVPLEPGDAGESPPELISARIPRLRDQP